MKVEIQSKKWIKPATPTPPHLQKHQLSAIDQLQPPFFVPLIFHFEINNEADANPDRISRLEDSLSKVLTLYYPFAGKYDANDSLVCCEDQGVEFVVASVDCKLDGVAEDKKDLLSGLEKILSFSGAALTPVVSVQVNVFTCGGLIICFSFNHKVCDMYTVATFMDAWATACRRGELDDKAVWPSFNTSSLLPPRDYLKPPSKTPQSSETELKTPPKFVSKRYIFTAKVLSELKRSINGRFDESEAKSSIKYTRVELVMAIVARSLAKIEHSRGTPLVRPLVISQPMNLRPKLTLLPIEENCCGNLCTRLTSSLQWGKQFPDLREVAGFIRSCARSAASEIEKVRDWTELSERVEESYMEFSDEARKGEMVNLVRFSSWCRFPLYEVDFGWGRPSLICTIPVPGVIFIVLMDCKREVDDGGIEAWVCLKEEDIARFQNEPDILEYAAF